MTVLVVRHVTRYRYAREVGFGEHRLMLRPHAAPDQELISSSLVITPRPIELSFFRDRFGHELGAARFDQPGRELVFDCQSMVRLVGEEMAGQADEADVRAAAQPRHADPQGRLEAWALSFVSEAGDRPLEVMAAINQDIHQRVRYVRRLERGVQAPLETLALGAGACRDQAMLLIEAARRLGWAARFVSGYVHCPPAPGGLTRLGGGHTHAWARVYVPRWGWMDFDPTNGAVGGSGLVRVAAVDDPEDAIPLHGAFFGDAADALGMEVAVEVRAAAEPDAATRVASCAA